MKKIISFILTMIMLLTCTSISVMAADTQSDTTNQDGKMTIGVSVYNLNDAEVRALEIILKIMSAWLLMSSFYILPV